MSSIPSDARGKPHMLIVDDEEGLRMALRTLFHAEFELHLCRSSIEAVKVLERRRISIAILDIKLKGESGLDLLKRLKTEDPLMEVIMLTAYDSIEDIQSAVRDQAYDFLPKPFDIAVMATSVSRALRQRNARFVASYVERDAAKNE